MSGHLCARRTDGAAPAYHVDPAYCPACQTDPETRSDLEQLRHLEHLERHAAALEQLRDRADEAELRRAADRQLIVTSLVLPLIAALVILLVRMHG